MTTIVLAALVGALVVQAPAKPSDFNGVWVLDAEKSVLMDPSRPGFELSVVDSGKTVKVVRSFRTSNPKVPNGVASESYAGTTDGKPSEERFAGMIYSRLLAREGKDLVWRVTLTRTSDGASTIFSERWSLFDDGNTLTIHRTYRGGREVTEVFARKRQADRPRRESPVVGPA
jgi:hypothetical protein